MLLMLVSLTGLPAIDPGKAVEIGIERCQSHSRGLDASRSERIDETKARRLVQKSRALKRELLTVHEPA